ncbi:MAG: ABC transporter ATP-binding protein [Candidatus Riflebacteria bacterium]|nr:ABC transporter ATP-binding protein [Candidatus Riflebacteria bacterium]
MNPTDPVIVLADIRKKYGEFEALKGINLDIRAGELFGFLGPNGAGKTTLIRILTGIIQPTAGRVTIRGADLQRQPEAAKARIGYVPDRPYLYEKLTPREYFDFVAGLYSIPSAQAQVRGEEMLRRFSLWEWRDELIESFSHGMKQKVAMSSALLHDPDILVVDEPTVGLDPRSVKVARDFFKELVRQGKTIFLTTHTLSVAEDLCDRIGIIHRGTMVALGTLDALRDQAKAPGSDLESVFLKITEEEDLPPPANPA